MNARFAPIECGKVAPAPTHIPAPRPQHLDEPRAQPDHEAMEWTSEYAVLSQVCRPSVPADPDDVFSEDEDADHALAVAVNDSDTLKALALLHANKVLPDHVWHVINEASMAMAEKRLNGSQA